MVVRQLPWFDSPTGDASVTRPNTQPDPVVVCGSQPDLSGFDPGSHSPVQQSFSTFLGPLGVATHDCHLATRFGIPLCQQPPDPEISGPTPFWACLDVPRSNGGARGWGARTRVQPHPTPTGVSKLRGGVGGVCRATPQTTSPALSKVSRPSVGSPCTTLRAFEILCGRAPPPPHITCVRRWRRRLGNRPHGRRVLRCVTR